MHFDGMGETQTDISLKQLNKQQIFGMIKQDITKIEFPLHNIRIEQPYKTSENSLFVRGIMSSRKCKFCEHHLYNLNITKQESKSKSTYGYSKKLSKKKVTTVYQCKISICKKSICKKK